MNVYIVDVGILIEKVAQCRKPKCGMRVRLKPKSQRIRKNLKKWQSGMPEGRNGMIKAVWGIGYDYRTDSCYDEPQHEDCQAPVVLDDESGKYVCLCCGEEVEIDDDMKKWLEERDGRKEEIGDCFTCGGKNTMVTYKHKNNVTLEWEAGYGECSKCGARYIV